MGIEPIKTKADYQAALKEIEMLMDAKARCRAESCHRHAVPTGLEFLDHADACGLVVAGAYYGWFQ
jgi:antitoxin component HigA of HigAB toxin-antitoxin module